MIVFDLKCDAGHGFEGWFGSSDDFADQQQRGMIQCPVCGTGEVKKAVQAPNVAPKSNQRASVPLSNAPEIPAELMQKLVEIQTKMLADLTWVGGNFVDRARAMHYGEEERATIHGSATPDSVAEMIEEGIALAPLPLPIVPPEEQN